MANSKTKGAGSVPINFKLPAEVNEEIVALQQAHKETEGFHISKAAVIIKALKMGLPLLNQQNSFSNEESH